LKTKNLDGIDIDLPQSSRTARIGNVKRKHTTFDIWALGDGEEQPVGGEEIRGLSCLLPRKKKKGKLYQAPKPIARHLVIVAQPVTPAPETTIKTEVTERSGRQKYPKELLKHRYIPYGSSTNRVTEESPDAEMLMVSAADEPTEPVIKVEETPKKKEKKRKGGPSLTESVAKKTKKIKLQ
jgi:hypothetical protein